jgi:hypothetical protein
LDEFTDEDVTELLDSHEQQLFNEDLEEQAEETRQKGRRKKQIKKLL